MRIFESPRKSKRQRGGEKKLSRKKLGRFEQLEKREVLSTTIALNMADYAGDAFTIQFNGTTNEIEVLAGTTEIRSEPASTLTSVTLNGSAAAETVTIGNLGTVFTGAVYLNASTGTDTLDMDDTSGVDSVIANASTDVITMTTHGGTGYTVTANDFENALLYARNGGADTAQLRGTASYDYGKARPEDDLCWLYDNTGNADDFYFRTKFFEVVHLYGEGGDDVLDLRDTAGNDDLVISPNDDQVRLLIDGLWSTQVRGKFFETVYASFSEGGADAVDYEGCDGADDVHLDGSIAQFWAGGYSSPDVYYYVSSLSSNDYVEVHSNGGTLGTNRADVDSPYYDYDIYGTWWLGDWYDA